MSQYCFNPFQGHLTQKLIALIEKEFPEVSVVNYREPRGEKRGWFVGLNRGEPFDGNLCSRVMTFVRQHASAADLEKFK